MTSFDDDYLAKSRRSATQHPDQAAATTVAKAIEGFQGKVQQDQGHFDFAAEIQGAGETATNERRKTTCLGQ